jgi:hypothetical protein
LKNGEDTFTKVEDIEAHTLQYFSTILSSPNKCTIDDLPSKYIPTMVTTMENEKLIALPLPEEIKLACLGLNGTLLLAQMAKQAIFTCISSIL